MTMQPSPWLYDFLKQYERFRPTAYAATNDERRRGIWTCGWGHTKGVTEQTRCSTSEAQEWLVTDVASSAVAVASHITVPLTQNQYDALCSLVFNCGPKPLLETLGHKLNARDYAGAAAEFPKWDRQAGAVVQGLLNRRDAEMARFNTPDFPARQSQLVA